MDFVVPVAMELVAPQTHSRKFVILDLGAGWIASRVKFGVNLQSLRRGRRRNEIDNDFVAQKRLPAPVLADEAEQSVLDLVPLAGARRKVAHGDPQPRFICQFL